MISCDEVFDVLTRGPFPTGRPSDGVVEAHLGHCADCQRLAEALRPAVELFEAVAPEESRTLPSYGGRLRSSVSPFPWEAALAEALPVVVRPEPQSVSIPQRQNLLASFISGGCPVNLARFATAALLGAVVVGAAYQMGMPQVQAFAKRLFGGSGDIAQAKTQVEVSLKGVTFSLLSDCLSLSAKDTLKGERDGDDEASDALQLDRADPVLALNEFDAGICCTQCHKINAKVKTVAMKRATGQVANTCNLCHDFSKTAH